MNRYTVIALALLVVLSYAASIVRVYDDGLIAFPALHLYYCPGGADCGKY